MPSTVILHFAFRPSILAMLYNAREDTEELRKIQYPHGVAPGSFTYTVLQLSNSDRVLSALSWGFPRDPIARHFAKIEHASTSPLWRDSYRYGRCIVPVSGFWNPRGVFIEGARAVLHFAGLRNLNSGHVSILSTNATEASRFVGRRVPVVLSEDLVDEWLDPLLINPDSLKTRILAAEQFFVPGKPSTEENWEQGGRMAL